MQRREFMSLLGGAAVLGAAIKTASAAPAEPVPSGRFGALGNGKTDDVEAINGAIRTLSMQGGGTLSFDGDKTYYITKAIHWLPSVNLQGNGCTIVTDRGIVMLKNPSPSWEPNTTGHRDEGLIEIANATVVAQPREGDRELTLSGVTGFSVGHTVMIRLGENPDDTPESKIALLATIAAIDPARSTITLDRPVPRTVDIAGISELNRSVRTYNHSLHDVWLDGFNFECRGTPNIQCGVFVEWARNIRISNITGNRNGGINMGAGLFVSFRSEGLTIENYRLYRNDNTHGQNSMGRTINLGTCTDCVLTRGQAENIQSTFSYVESYCRNVVFNDIAVSHADNKSGTFLFFAGAESEVTQRNTRVLYKNGYVLDDSGGTPSDVTFDGLSCTGAFPIALEQPGRRLAGLVSIDDGAGRRIVFDMNATTTHEVTRRLRLFTRAEIELERGVLLDAEIHLSDDIRGLESIWFGTNFANTWRVDDALNAGKSVKVTPPGGPIGSNGRLYTTMTKLLQPATVTIAAHKYAIPAGRVVIRYRIARIVTSSGPAGTRLSGDTPDVTNKVQTTR